MKELSKIITIFLFFVLILGLVIIFKEEIFKSEFLGRIQTTAIPTVTKSGETQNFGLLRPQQIVQIPKVITTITKESFRGTNNVHFGSGRIVTNNFNDIEKINKITPLHTISSGVSDYFARGFIKESAEIYKTSIHAGKIIFLDRASSVKESRVNREYFVLLLSDQLEGQLTISDWRIFDRKERVSYRIPNGIEVLGSTRGIEKSVPIKLSAGGVVVVSSGRSPAGVSFNINKCSSYRSQFKKFVPTIKTNCPSPTDEFIADGSIPFSDNVCYEEIYKLRACRAIVDIPAGITSKCRTFIENTLTEAGCVRLHRNDPDFFTSEWRIFLESEKELWSNENNVLYLLDSDNNLVATLVYE